jgi:hypothetical protein
LAPPDSSQGLGLSEKRVDLRPSVGLVTLNDLTKRQAFFEVLDWYVDEITEAANGD